MPGNSFPCGSLIVVLSYLELGEGGPCPLSGRGRRPPRGPRERGSVPTQSAQPGAGWLTRSPAERKASWPGNSLRPEKGQCPLVLTLHNRAGASGGWAGLAQKTPCSTRLREKAQPGVSASGSLHAAHVRPEPRCLAGASATSTGVSTRSFCSCIQAWLVQAFWACSIPGTQHLCMNKAHLPQVLNSDPPSTATHNARALPLPVAPPPILPPDLGRTGTFLILCPILHPPALLLRS